jgi:hypothetical protein
MYTKGLLAFTRMTGDRLPRLQGTQRSRLIPSGSMAGLFGYWFGWPITPNYPSQPEVKTNTGPPDGPGGASAARGRSTSMGWCAAKIPQNAPSLVSVGSAMGWSVSTRCERPWPAIDLAELRYCLAFGSSVEEMADFLHRHVEDVRHQIAVEAQRVASRRPH